MARKSLKQSAKKEEFLRALGLNEQIQDDKLKFAAMWREVVSYWVLHFEAPHHRSSLRPEYVENQAVQRPYKWAHLSNDAIDCAINAIWTAGQPVPRQFYDSGHSEDRRIYNWVLKWLLWHVCRYRDWRNRKPRGSTGGGAGAIGPSAARSIAGPSQAEDDPNVLPSREYWATVMN